MAISRRTQAFSRLAKKLEALRVTLPDDEREILDGLMKKDEVEAHKIKQSAARDLARAAKSRIKSAPEVQAHKMTTRAAARKSARASAKAKAR